MHESHRKHLRSLPKVVSEFQLNYFVNIKLHLQFLKHHSSQSFVNIQIATFHQTLTT